MAATISVAMIVRNEGAHLRECLTQIRPLADELCIVDTGSTDDTLAIAREFGARTSVFIWCEDFSAARNESLRLCTGDWIFVLDADERIEPSRLREIRALASGPRDISYWLPIRNYTNTTSVADFVPCAPGDPLARGFAGWFPSQRVRYWPNGTGAQFEGKVHEMIGYSLERLGLRTGRCDVPVHHYPLIARATDRILEKQTLYLRLGHEKIQQDPDNYYNYVELGNQYAEVGDYTQAAAAYREALKRNPADPSTLKDLGGMLHLIRRDEEAKLAIKLAIELDPELTEAWRNLGVVYADSQEWEAALECFQRAIHSDPNWLEGYRYMSVALEGMERVNEAAKFSQVAFESLPNNPQCLKLFIHQMLRLGRRSEARDVILEAIGKGADNPDLHNALGELFFYDSLFDDAKAHFLKAGEMGLPGAYNNLGVVQFRLQEYDEARQSFEHCLTLDPNHVGAQRNLEKVAKVLKSG